LCIKKRQSKVENIRGVFYLDEKRRANKLATITDASGVGNPAPLQAAPITLAPKQELYILEQ
jgi:hypothetical protein